MQHSPGRASPEADAAFADPAFAAPKAAGAPFVVARPADGEVLWANAAAAAHFDAGHPAALSRALFGRGAWLDGLVAGLVPGRPPRLARAGLARGFGMRAHTALIRAWASDGGDVLVGFAVPDAPSATPSGPDAWLRPAWPAEAGPAGTPELTAEVAAAPEPPAEAAPPVDPDGGAALARRGQIAVLRDRLSRALDGAATARLLWRTDAGGVAAPAGTELLARLGVPFDLAGGPLAGALAPFDPAGAGRLAEALAGRATWSGLVVDLPVAGGSAVVPLSLAASPVFGPDRAFAGFRGFGTIDLGRLELAAPRRDGPPAPAAPAEADPDAAADGAPAPPAERPPEAADGAPGANVVHLRAFQTSAPGRASPAPRPAGEGGVGDDAPPVDGDAAPPLSDELAFRALGEALRARIGAPAGVEPSAPDPTGDPPDGATDGPGPAVADRDAPTLLDQLPVPVLALARGAPVYANPAAAALLGYPGPAALLAAGPELVGSEEGALTLHGAGGGAVSFPAWRSAASWAGAPATVYVFEPPSTLARGPAGEGRDAAAGELLDRVDDAVALLDGDGRLRRLNRRGEAWFGALDRSAPGPAFPQLLAPESRPGALALLDEVRAARGNGAGPPLRCDVLALVGEGAPAPMLLTLGRLGASGFYLTLRDAAASRRAPGGENARDRGAADGAGRSSALLAKINHEVRTPLSAILGFAEVMMDERFGPLGNPRYKDYLRDIHAAGAQVVASVEDLLDLSRIEAGQVELAVAPLDVNRVVSETVAQMQAEANRGRIIVRTSLAGRLPAALADERSARQIVRNLLSNAVKFNEPGGQVIVSTALGEGGAVLLRVRDTGIGMTEGEIAAAMEPFGEATVADPSEGGGLGLPLTRALAGANGASIAIRSRPREGTLVEVSFATAPGQAREVG